MIWVIFVYVCNKYCNLPNVFIDLFLLNVCTLNCSNKLQQGEASYEENIHFGGRTDCRVTRFNGTMQKINITNSVIATHGRSAADSGHSTRGTESVSQDWGVKEFSSCIAPATAVIVRRAWSDCEQNPDIPISGDGWHIRYSGDCSSGVQRSVAEVPESDKDSAAESPGECWMIPVNPPSYMLVSLAGGYLSSARYCWNTILNLSGYFIVTVLTQTPLLCAVLDNYVDIYVSRTQIECDTAAAKVQSYIFTTIPPAVATQ